MAPGQSWHIGLTFLVPRIPGGRWLCGVAIFAALYGLFWLAGTIGSDAADQGAGSRAAALFFCAVIAYIVPVFDYISDRTAAAIETLAPEFDPNAGPVATIRARVHWKPRRWFVVVFGIGFAAAIAHNLLLAAGDGPAAGNRFAWMGIVFGSTLTWVVLTLVISALIDNATLLNRLARSVRLNPLAAERLHPFALVAVLSTLALVGAQAAFPIMILDAATSAVAFMPGLLGTSVPMVVLAVLPIWPLHQRLRTAKRALLEDVRQRIALAPPPTGTPDTMTTLAPLLAWRREVEALPDWPFDIGIVGRLGLYLIIPPLTWVGAALIQHVVEKLL